MVQLCLLNNPIYQIQVICFERLEMLISSGRKLHVYGVGWLNYHEQLSYLKAKANYYSF